MSDGDGATPKSQKEESESQKLIQDSSSSSNLTTKTQEQKEKEEFGSQESQKQKNDLSSSSAHLLPMPLDPLHDPGHHWKKRRPGQYMLPNLERFHIKKTRIHDDICNLSPISPPRMIIRDDGWHYNFLKSCNLLPCRICSSDGHGHINCPYTQELPPGAEKHIDANFCVILCSCGQNVSQDGDCPEWCVGTRYVMERARKKFLEEDAKL